MADPSNDPTESAGEPAADRGLPPVEQRRDRTKRHLHRGVLYGWAFLWVVLLGLVVVWVVRNRGTVEVDWVFGSTGVALALVLFIAVALGWVLGLLTAMLIRRRTRAPR